MGTREANLSICCEVCAEIFSHEEGHIPKLISCGHSFCDGCLTKLQNTSNNQNRLVRNGVFQMHNRYEITCPKCKKKTVSDKPCSFLPKNYSYLDLIDDILVKSERNKDIYCKEHTNYVLDMFCHSEGKAICLKCAYYGEHKGHYVDILSEFADRQRQSIKKRIDVFENIIDNYGKLFSALEEREQYLTNKVEYIRKNIISKFASVQSEIKRILELKLKAVLDQLDNCCTVQLSLLQNAKHSLNTQEFEDIQTKARTFLSEADECTVAKETYILGDMQAKIDETENHTMCTKHVYEVMVDNYADHIVQSLKDLVVARVCCVKETKAASYEYVSTVVERYRPSTNHGNCSNLKFGENPFGGIECKLW